MHVKVQKRLFFLKKRCQSLKKPYVPQRVRKQREDNKKEKEKESERPHQIYILWWVIEDFSTLIEMAIMVAWNSAYDACPPLPFALCPLPFGGNLSITSTCY